MGTEQPDAFSLTFAPARFLRPGAVLRGERVELRSEKSLFSAPSVNSAL